MTAEQLSHSDELPEAVPLVVGIGSSHGDDRAGWAAVDALADLVGNRSILRKAAVPIDMLNWLNNVHELHIVDVCQIDGDTRTLQPVYRWDWSVLPAAIGNSTQHEAQPIAALQTAKLPPSDRRVDVDARPQPEPIQSTADSSHSFDVLSVLHLAQQLGQLPERVILWAIPGTCFDAAAELSQQICGWLPDVAQQISAELRDA